MTVRVLYFVGAFEQGGTERQVAELVSRLPRDRYEPHLAVCGSSDQLGYPLGVASQTDLGAPQGPEPRTLARLTRLIHSLAPDIVHAYHDPQNSYARLAARIAGCGQVIGSLRSTRLPRRTLRRERLTAPLGAAVVVNAEGIRAELERARVDVRRVHVVPNGVDASRFRPLRDDERRRARERFGMEGPTFIVPARIAAQKNQLTIVRAVARLAASGAWPKRARVIMAGRREPHGRYGWWVDAAVRAVGGAARAAGFSGVVQRMEPIADIETLLGAADGVLLPSHYEGVPNAVVEALACGVPCVVSEAANTSGLVLHDRTGLVLKSVSVDAVGSALGKLVRQGERLREGALGAREAFAARFGVERMVADTCAVYERVLGGSAGQ